VRLSSKIFLMVVVLACFSCSSSIEEEQNELSLEENGNFLQAGSQVKDPVKHPSVFQIKGLGCNSLQYGTGFFIDESIVVTNAHVVAGVNSPEIIYRGNSYELDFISFDQNSDLAILRSENIQHQPLKLDEAEEGEFATVGPLLKMERK